MRKIISKVKYEFCIRGESERDYQSISSLLKSAFAAHPYSRQNEHLLVDTLRVQKGLVIANVACIDETLVIGHIAFSVVYVNGVFVNWYMLAPLAVLPEYQNKGVGAALVIDALEALKRIGAKGVILVGDPAYYCRFGFAASSGLHAKGVPSEYLLALALDGDIVQGDVTFHEAFLLFE